MKRKLSSLIAAVFIGIGAFSCICQAAGMDIDKEDGEYSIQVDLEGGSGKRRFHRFGSLWEWAGRGRAAGPAAEPPMREKPA